MSNPPWRDQLIQDLRRQGLPAFYIDRLAEELTDHVADLKQEKSMDAQAAFQKLGTTANLALAARTEFDRRTFSGRHPVLTFVVGPMLVAPLAFLGCLLLAFGVAWLAATIAESLAPQIAAEIPRGGRLETWCVACFDLYARFLPFALVAWLYCRLGRRGGSLRWPLAACLITATIACFVFTKCLPATATSPGTYTVGLTFGLSLRPDLRQLPQLLPPLAVAALFLLRPQSPKSLTAAE